ncbi:hypothetical protein M3I54_26960 [Paraburkholderia sp. CNPSo 3274]|uniref:hypothetical protein n=1 Tax=Paraburkholderia sp. CNPSo 3274 TaxID=2940932 RepID=UPI0020B8C6AE|nr:hypothetical protein [Paraburkholderia sp. CNPSo 3274]MCP3710568.1 hypothetical protein [Paraburkholderia sp. CNPSo 3274]
MRPKQNRAAAASSEHAMMPRERRLAVMHAGRPLCVWASITGGASALAGGVMIAAMQAGAPFAAFAASALALLAMALIPGTLARCIATRATVPIASALVLTIAAMSAGARAGATLAQTPLILGGIALIAAACAHLRCARDGAARSMHTHATAPVWHNGILLTAPALLAGLSSGVLARFQFFALCGGAPISVTQVVTSLAVVSLAGWLADRVDYRRALLVLFVLRGSLLASLTFDCLAPWAALAAPAFAVLDYLTLPTLMRGGRASRASGAGCPGLAHHAGMLAGAALATTSWGFGQGFYALFLVGGALNLACAYAFATPRRFPTHAPYAASAALAAGSTIDLL